MIVKTLSECIDSENLFDTIFLRNSYGKDFTCFHYNSLGLGNLLTGYAGAHSIIQLSGPKKILSFPKNRIQPKLIFFRSPIRWFARSEFGIDKLGDLYRRYVLLKKIKQVYIDTTISFIDKSSRVLYLSTHMVNDDVNYMKIVSKNIESLKNDKNVFRLFGVDFTKVVNKIFYDKGLNIGVHLRRGDFLISETNKTQENSSPPINSVIEILNIFKNYKISTITIYSDQSKKLTNNIINEHFPKRLKYRVFSRFSKGALVINDMIKNHILIQSNSSLSTWSGIVSGQISPFIGDSTPYYIDKEFNNFIRSDGNFSSDLILLINSEFDLNPISDHI
tara:strand:- start:315 stop:1316 length:1002 start_codon:yes stop_codon:yes gene_type:complete